MEELKTFSPINQWAKFGEDLTAEYKPFVISSIDAEIKTNKAGRKYQEKRLIVVTQNGNVVTINAMDIWNQLILNFNLAGKPVHEAIGKIIFLKYEETQQGFKRIKMQPPK